MLTTEIIAIASVEFL